MDFLRVTACVCTLLVSTLSYSNTLPQGNEGIVLVHGTKDHREDAEGDYWKYEFIDALSAPLPTPENRLVVHCDFTPYMWDEAAAGCMVNQMLDFARDRHITSYTVYTHSDGGNVMRWVLSNPAYDPRYIEVLPLIREVIALAPSSGGTILADQAVDGNFFEEGLGWLLGYQTNSVKQQRVGDMAVYNDELLYGSPERPNLVKPFRVVVGTDVTASPFNSASYCNGYWLNTALKVTRLYLDDCADGFLDCSSQAEAGEVWFYDWQKTVDGIQLSHNQSRHSCFGLEDILNNDRMSAATGSLR
ncbi:hypothetical protein E3226_011600 [Legionella geestiana]|uniref:hypothetical protein n=1 Tax=Legionella geestiana TaxID=45065 RepID=UPI00109335BA|nr:hypothetical protein [Legionella geestiana]QDQ41002.1 hypothetical protein E3226_011600 [Legionella geestiana]